MEKVKISEKYFEKVLEGKEKAVSLHSQNNGNEALEKRGRCWSGSSLNEWSKQSLKGKKYNKKKNLINSRIDPSQDRNLRKEKINFTKKSLILAQDER